MSQPTKKTKVTTNAKKNSTHQAETNVRQTVEFSKLEAAYPSSPPCVDAKGKPLYEDQCAIKVSTALQKAGFSLKTFRGSKCHAHSDIVHALRAEELAAWLVSSLGTADKYTGKTYYKGVKDKKGIIFFKNYWYRSAGERRTGRPTGDHIDVWTGENMKGGELTWVRIHLNVSWEGWITDFESAEEVWFWELK